MDAGPLTAAKLIALWEEVDRPTAVEQLIIDRLRTLIAEKMDGKATHLVVPKVHEDFARRIARHLKLELRATAFIPDDSDWFALNVPSLAERDWWTRDPTTWPKVYLG